jgi:hypothetical protein
MLSGADLTNIDFIEHDSFQEPERSSMRVLR